MKILLIFPPHWEPTMPYLSLPSLKAFLTINNINSHILDANIKSWQFFLSPHFLNFCFHKLKNYNYPQAIITKQFGRNFFIRILERADFLRDTILHWIDVLRNPNKISNQELYKQAIKNISYAFEIISFTFYPSKLNWANFLSPYQQLNIQQVYRAIEDSKTNPYFHFYKHYLKNIIKSLKPDLIGFSVIHPGQIIPCWTFIYNIKKEFKDVKIIVGGPFFSKFPDILRKNKEFFKFLDAFILFEGEIALLKYIQYLNGNLPVEKVPNLIAFHKNRVIFNENIEIVHNINELPIPDFQDYEPDKNYLIPKTILPVLTQRHCYYRKCAFCTGYGLNLPFREKKPEIVLNELKFYVEKFNTNNFIFVDQATTPRMLKKISQLIIDNNLRINWGAQIRIENSMTKKLLNLMKKSGCKLLIIGVESFVDRVLNLMRKNYNSKQILQFLQNSLSLDFLVHLFMIVGFPGENEEEANKSFKILLNLLSKHKNLDAFYHHFVLEKDSAVYFNPTSFFITSIKPESPDSLPYQFQYMVEKGINQQLAIKLSREFQKYIDSIKDTYSPYSTNYAFLLKSNLSENSN